eukprot:CAMPEP_0177644300 /NCGR_PEP_ID=MMETSP0447-20121125/8610_1 /TAXON_ID=0 /ORGANISM="Stygamoeba regulata, Strain BSH-02190019" /LENGTH=306 /DNA_ID=CAMNT_0019146643 /DNA_START=183 /DNA_END=1103 /DNA_ORIENTATION=+
MKLSEASSKQKVELTTAKDKIIEFEKLVQSFRTEFESTRKYAANLVARQEELVVEQGNSFEARLRKLLDEYKETQDASLKSLDQEIGDLLQRADEMDQSIINARTTLDRIDKDFDFYKEQHTSRLAGEEVDVRLQTLESADLSLVNRIAKLESSAASGSLTGAVNGAMVRAPTDFYQPSTSHLVTITQFQTKVDMMENEIGVLSQEVERLKEKIIPVNVEPEEENEKGNDAKEGGAKEGGAKEEVGAKAAEDDEEELDLEDHEQDQQKHELELDLLPQDNLNLAGTNLNGVEDAHKSKFLFGNEDD